MKKTSSRKRDAAVGFAMMCVTVGALWAGIRHLAPGLMTIRAESAREVAALYSPHGVMTQIPWTGK